MRFLAEIVDMNERAVGRIRSPISRRFLGSATASAAIGCTAVGMACAALFRRDGFEATIGLIGGGAYLVHAGLRYLAGKEHRERRPPP